ncbi:hypothetical protein HYC85_028654 [Camellia sinensis]|uniref:Uncharacterized protein n=1 Tax=Camellia sinensis TaxID=4442 RepID=A0A7J7FVS3_CAMSI|nr:hypothetical protein HYC85_028654 [Camellia sinensis]
MAALSLSATLSSGKHTDNLTTPAPPNTLAPTPANPFQMHKVAIPTRLQAFSSYCHTPRGEQFPMKICPQQRLLPTWSCSLFLSSKKKKKIHHSQYDRRWAEPVGRLTAAPHLSYSAAGARSL